MIIPPEVTAKFRRDLNNELNDRIMPLSTGQAGDYAEYKETCGTIKGLQLALKLFDDLVKLVNEGRHDESAFR